MLAIFEFSPGFIHRVDIVSMHFSGSEKFRGAAHAILPNIYNYTYISCRGDVPRSRGTYIRDQNMYRRCPGSFHRIVRARGLGGKYGGEIHFGLPRISHPFSPTRRRICRQTRLRRRIPPTWHYLSSASRTMGILSNFDLRISANWRKFRNAHLSVRACVRECVLACTRV